MTQGKKSLEPEVIDLPSVLERIGGDETFLQELLKIYLEEFQSKVSELEKAVANQNFSAIQELGHSLKGSSANLSLLELQRVAYSIEMAGREANLGQSQENLKKIKEAFDRLRTYLADCNWWKSSE